MSGPEGKVAESLSVMEAGEQAVEAGGGTMKKRRCMYEVHVQPCLVEMFGTSLFVFVGCAAVIGNVEAPGAIQPAVAHGLILGVLVMLFGQISGGHFNPAVSLSIYLCGGMELLLLLPYILAQMAGAMIGATITKVMYPSGMYVASLGGAFNATTADVGKSTLAEVMMTLVLTIVVCMGTVNRKSRTPWAPFCIGLTVTACVLAGGSVSGACMNPARAFGPAVAANQWNNHWVYWVGPTCGALLTVSFIRLLFGDQRTRVVLK
ncbi:PREDICTED: aquaporin-8-like [Cyprinodon variegatus]|uniref:Aquaporin-4 n=1 Tax=Cyprinodon variegatus TaxID=28743 RepID=A0A3Q2DFZ9_CYPVA|nr:PREDICTED: aquaporin-8-like [Cyprinodon variegatus]